MTFEQHLLWNYGLSVDEVEPTDVPGYWRIKTPCGGAGVCRHPMHAFLGLEGPTRHTIRYVDRRRDERGQFASPYQTWREAVAAARR